MREARFRGVWSDGLGNSEWVYGFYCKDSDGDHLIQESSDLYTKSVITNPETIGQFTGLKDKNGKDIYEGDICKWRFKRAWSTEYHIAEVIWKQSKCGWRLNTKGDTDKMREDIEYEIIGNITDNPELMEVRID